MPPEVPIKPTTSEEVYYYPSYFEPEEDLENIVPLSNG